MFHDDIVMGGSSSMQEELDLKNKRNKGNTKNTYIKKISSLMKISNDQVEDQDRKVMPHKIQSMQFAEKEDKLAKNRESARNSRRRKKIYLELLENKVTKLSEQLEVFKKVYERNQDLAQHLQNKISQKREQDNNKAILFQNLQNAVQGNTSENNIDSIIDSLNKKFGSGSIERHQLIEHYSRQIYENCLSPHINYILTQAKQKQDIYSQMDDDTHILKKLKLTDKQKSVLLKKQNKLIKHYDDLTRTLQSVDSVKIDMQNELTSFDTTLETLRKELKASQVAKFLLAIEKKDMQHHFKDNFEKTFGSEIDEDDSLDLYQFMTEHNQCNSLGIDIQNTYEIYRASNDFLHGKCEEDIKQE
ncbi:hypothetical protein pb186bvf_015503 [Paramecium bursaria]